MLRALVVACTVVACTLVLVVAAAAPSSPTLARMPGEIDSPSAPASAPDGAPDSANGDGADALDDGQDYSDVDDPLGGKRILLDATDVLVMNPSLIDSDKPTGQVELRTDALPTTNGSVGSGTHSNLALYNCGQSNTDFDPFPWQQRPARFFDDTEDQVLDVRLDNNQLTCDQSSKTHKHGILVLKGQSGATVTSATVSSVDSLPFALAVADFTLDGYDDALVMTPTQIYGLTATDVEQSSSGLTVGSRSALSNIGAIRTLNDPAVADLDGDGLLEVAHLEATITGTSPLVKLVIHTVCPGSVSGTVCDGAKALDIKTRRTITLTTGYTACNGPAWNSMSFGAWALAAGEFGGSTRLVVINSVTNSKGHCNPIQRVYHFDASMNATLETQNTADDYFNYVDSIFARTARLDWFSGEDQLVWAVYGHKQDNSHEVKSLNVLDMDTTAAMTNTRWDETVSDTEYLLAGGVDVGVFGALASTDTESTDYNLAIALLVYNRKTANKQRIELFSWDASNKKLSRTQTFDLPSQNWPADRYHSNGGNRLHAVDLQGRSVRVGEPDVLRLDSTQAEMTVGMPPMHVDYVQTAGKTAPVVFNFSAIPDSFSANYATTSGSTITKSTDHDNSWSMEGKESVSAEAKTTGLTSMVAGQAGFKLTQTFSETKSHEVDRVYTSSSSITEELTSATSFDDVVYYTNQRVNTSHYPVLGETACADGTTTCSDPNPVYYVVSMVDDCQSTDCQDITTAYGSGAGQEWYQPVHEPGQLFSYPWNRTQLTKRFPDAVYVTSSDIPAFFTDSTAVTENVTWSTDSVTNETTTNSHGWGTDTSLSMYYGTPQLEDAVAGAKVSVDVDFSHSNATKTVNVSNSETSSSRGVGISKPGTFKTPLSYAYSVQGHIFGQSTPDGTFDLQTQTADIASSGTLQAAFTANPLASGAGSWWSSSPYKTYFDVALNHPARWSVTAVNYDGQITDPDDCVRQNAGDTNLDCATINQPISGDWWNSEFYWMKGLLVTTGTGDAANAQSRAANDGDTVTLQARVYNYSLKDMGTNKIHVRFYRQQWDHSDNTPIGTSAQIGSDVVLSGLPAFGNASNTPNWTTAATTWDTTGQGGSYWVFWVLVYAADASGNLLAELPGHGLSSKPGTLTSIFDAPLEKATITLDNGTSETVTFSNNVGYLHSDFYVAESSGTSAAQASDRPEGGPVGVGAPGGTSSLRTSSAQSAERRLEIRNLTAKPYRARLGEPIVIGAEIHAPDAEVQGAAVDFFDGLPGLGQRFDSEYAAWIDGGEMHHVSAVFRPKTCGPRVVTLVVAPRHHITARGVVPVDVECPHTTWKVFLPATKRHHS